MGKPQSESKGDSKSMICLGAFLGGFIAVLADLVAKNKASTVLAIADVFYRTFRAPDGGKVPIAALTILCLGVGVCFVLRIAKREDAFKLAVGFLSTFITVVPYRPEANEKVQITSEAASDASSGQPANPGGPGRSIYFQDFAARRYSFVRVAAASPQKSGSVEIHLTTEDDNESPEATFTIRDVKTRRIIAQPTLKGDAFVLSMPPGTYQVSIEAPGYRIVSDNFNVQPGETEVLLADLKQTYAPIGVQQLFKGITGVAKPTQFSLRAEGALKVPSDAGKAQIPVLASKQDEGSFIFSFSLSRAAPGSVTIKLDEILVKQDGSAGRTRWLFEVFANDRRLFNVPVRWYDDKQNPPRYAMGPKDNAEATVPVSDGKDLQIRVIGYKPKDVRSSLQPIVNASTA